MSEIILKNERTGETIRSNSFQDAPSEKDFMKMPYMERFNLYQNDRTMYDHLVGKMKPPEKPKLSITLKPWDYDRNGLIVRKD